MISNSFICYANMVPIKGLLLIITRKVQMYTWPFVLIGNTSIYHSSKLVNTILNYNHFVSTKESIIISNALYSLIFIASRCWITTLGCLHLNCSLLPPVVCFDFDSSACNCVAVELLLKCLLCIYGLFLPIFFFVQLFASYSSSSSRISGLLRLKFFLEKGISGEGHSSIPLMVPNY